MLGVRIVVIRGHVLFLGLPLNWTPWLAVPSLSKLNCFGAGHGYISFGVFSALVGQKRSKAPALHMSEPQVTVVYFGLTARWFCRLFVLDTLPESVPASFLSESFSTHPSSTT